MKILDLKQGTDEWIQARLKYLCASEAPAMMGDSKFMSRNQLLALKKGWQSNPVGAFQQKLFDDGHENEDKAREIIEMELCEELPPVVGLNVVDELELLSSFDGFSIACDIWEHKNWNEILAENARNKVLEAHYYWQLEHQMLTAGIDRAFFTVSDGTKDRRVSIIYESIPERRLDIIAGWKQFIIDLDSFELEAKKEIVTASKQDDFPSIDCRVEGSMVVSNLSDYIPLIQNLSDIQMSIILESDKDFADKEAFNKNVKKAREALKQKASEIGDMFESLAEFNSDVEKADSILQKLQSHGERQVKESKETRKNEIINAGQSEIENHLIEVAGTINGVNIPGIESDWLAVIKGKRSFQKMEDAVSDEVAKLKIKINELSIVIRKNLDSLSELAGEYKFLFSDHADLILKDNDDLENLIKTRISDHDKSQQVKRENERAQFKKEAEEKAEKDRERIRKEESTKLKGESQVSQPIVGDATPVKNASKITLSVVIVESQKEDFVDFIRNNFDIEVTPEGQILIN